MKANKKEIKELKDKIAKAILKKKDKKVKKLNKALKLLIKADEPVKPVLSDKKKKSNKYTLPKKEVKKQAKKQVKNEIPKQAKQAIKERKEKMKQAVSASNVHPVTKNKDLTILNYGAAKSLETDHHRVGDIINIVRQPLDDKNKKIKIELGKHTIVSPPGKYLNSYIGVFVNGKDNKPVFIHFPYFNATPFTTRES